MMSTERLQSSHRSGCSIAGSEALTEDSLDDIPLFVPNATSTSSKPPSLPLPHLSCSSTSARGVASLSMRRLQLDRLQGADTGARQPAAAGQKPEDEDIASPSTSSASSSSLAHSEGDADGNEAGGGPASEGHPPSAQQEQPPAPPRPMPPKVPALSLAGRLKPMQDQQTQPEHTASIGPPDPAIRGGGGTKCTAAVARELGREQLQGAQGPQQQPVAVSLLSYAFATVPPNPSDGGLPSTSALFDTISQRVSSQLGVASQDVRLFEVRELDARKEGPSTASSTGNPHPQRHLAAMVNHSGGWATRTHQGTVSAHELSSPCAGVPAVGGFSGR
jgi:hypothetical protein